jgi:carboxymethylenebutenolidase
MSRERRHPEVLSLLPPAGLSRRQILASAVAGGFALAVQPIAATTINTDAKGLSAGDVRIPATGGDIPGYHAMPAKGGPFPVVLVVQEIFGVHEHIKDLCRRLAKQGYLAVAPSLYARQGDVSRLREIEDIMPVVAKVPDAQVMADLDSTAQWAKDSGKGDIARVGITGFCWGGRITWLYAAHSAQLKAGVAWYGRLSGERTELQPRYPIDIASELKAPVLGLYGGKDPGIPVLEVAKMREAVAKAGVPAEIVVYPDAPHGFNADYRGSYREADAKDAWGRMLKWFREHGVA